MAHAPNKAYLKKRKEWNGRHPEGRKAYSNARISVWQPESQIAMKL